MHAPSQHRRECRGRRRWPHTVACMVQCVSSPTAWGALIFSVPCMLASRDSVFPSESSLKLVPRALSFLSLRTANTTDLCGRVAGWCPLADEEINCARQTRTTNDCKSHYQKRENRHGCCRLFAPTRFSEGLTSAACVHHPSSKLGDFRQFNVSQLVFLCLETSNTSAYTVL